MTHASLPHQNGATNGAIATNGATAAGWLKQTVEQFFSHVNWEDQPPEIQILRHTAAPGQAQSLSLLLTVNQFLSAINWEGGAVAQPIKPAVEPSGSTQQPNAFTLEDFSDLF